MYSYAAQKNRYGINSFCVIGVAMPTASTPTAVQYDKLIIVLICEQRSGIILDVECNMVVDVTSHFIASLMIGRSIYTDLDEIIEDLRKNYNGISQKALIVALKDAYAKIQERGNNNLCKV